MVVQLCAFGYIFTLCHTTQKTTEIAMFSEGRENGQVSETAEVYIVPFLGRSGSLFFYRITTHPTRPSPPKDAYLKRSTIPVGPLPLAFPPQPKRAPTRDFSSPAGPLPLAPPLQIDKQMIGNATVIDRHVSRHCKVHTSQVCDASGRVPAGIVDPYIDPYTEP